MTMLLKDHRACLTLTFLYCIYTVSLARPELDQPSIRDQPVLRPNRLRSRSTFRSTFGRTSAVPRTFGSRRATSCYSILARPRLQLGEQPFGHRHLRPPLAPISGVSSANELDGLGLRDGQHLGKCARRALFPRPYSSGLLDTAQRLSTLHPRHRAAPTAQRNSPNERGCNNGSSGGRNDDRCVANRHAGRQSRRGARGRAGGGRWRSRW